MMSSERPEPRPAQSSELSALDDDEVRQLSAQLVRLSGDGLAVLAADGLVLFCNPSAHALLGTDSVENVRLPVSADVPSGTVVEFTHRRVDGSERVIAVTAFPLVWQGQRRILATLRDVTADRDAAAKLRVQARLLDVIGQAVLATDLDWHILYWNDRASTLLGWRPDKPSVRFVPGVVPPPEDAGRVAEAIAKGDTWYAESEVVCDDGSRIPVAVTYSGLVDVDSSLIGHIAVVSDLRSRIRQEQALRTSERRFRSLLDHLHLVAVILDCDGHVSYCNSSLLALTGWKREDLLGADWFGLLVPPESRDEARSRFIAECEQDRIPTQSSGQIVTRSGGRRLIAWSNTAVRETDGTVSAVACVGDDITDRTQAELDRKRLEEQLFQVQKMEAIGTLAGGIAHDVNNILAAIMSHASLISMSSRDGDPTAESIRAIIDSCERGADLTRQLLNIARGGKREIRSANPNEIVEDVLRLIRETFDRAIEIRTDLDQRPWALVCDAGQIHQTVMNICINARDAMPNGGVLTVTTRNVTMDLRASRQHAGLEPGRYVCISIADTGVGMPESIRGRIFDPFFSTKRHGLGTGLGLATSYGIVRSHGGQIEVQSEPGQGTVFYVYLPAEGTRARSATRITGDYDELPGGSETVLLVDDEDAIRKVGEAVLEKLGYRVLLAADGAEAVETYRQHGAEIGLVITDMVMPRQGGRATVQALRAIDRDCRILVSSGFSLNEDVTGALADGAVGFIQKPFTVRALAKSIRAAIDGSPNAVSSNSEAPE